jgi:hypothetical protein
MAGWLIINGMIPVLSHQSCDGQPLMYFRAEGAAGNTNAAAMMVG